MREINLIKNIYISEDAKDSSIALNIYKNADATTKINIIHDPKEILSFYRKNGKIDSRESLLVYNNKGSFLSSCPGTDKMVCCQYFVINMGQGCLFDCHYCYLQGFVNNPLITIFANTEDLFKILDERTLNKNTHFRIGTGEYADSLALEKLTGQSEILVNYFASHPNATLELKTKSSNIENLLNLNHNGHTVISWSLNPNKIINEIEIGTATLEERLRAAKKVTEVGYKIAFHLDPLIYFENWEKEYHDLIDLIFDYVSKDTIAWISTGSFRYTSTLKEMIEARFPDDKLTRTGEMLAFDDGKFRYFKNLRFEMFRSIKNKINSVDSKLFLYLCMENKQSWENVFGFIPSSPKVLDELFEKRRVYISNK